MKQRKIRIGDISVSYWLNDAVFPEKTIIFIHGFPFNKNMWMEQLEALPDGIRGIAIDVRGHGRTTMGHGFFSIDVFAKDLLVFMEVIEIERAVLCGISMGGYIALRTYELAPDKVEGLILADTNSHADSNEAKKKRFDTIQSVLKHGRRTFAIGFTKNVFAESSLKERGEAVELIKSSIRRNDVRSICATLLALAARTDTTDSLKTVPFPCLILRGEEDKLMSKEQAEELKNLIPNAEWVEIKHSGHLPNLENVTDFNAAMLHYLEQLS